MTASAIGVTYGLTRFVAGRDLGELPVTNYRDHGELAPSVQKHDRSWLRSINRPASREDAAILTSRYSGLVGSGVLSISASSSSQMSSRSFAPSDPSRSMTEPTNNRSSRFATVTGCSQYFPLVLAASCPLLFSIFGICVRASINNPSRHTFSCSGVYRGPFEEPNAGPVEPGLCRCYRNVQGVGDLFH